MTDQITHLQYTTLPVPLPDFIYEGLREYSAQSNVYHPQPQALVTRLAVKFNLSSEMFFLTAGADEAINLFALAYGERTHIFTPTYIICSEMTDFLKTVIQHPSVKDNTYTISSDTLEEASLIYLANPNNPFGSTTKEKIIELIKNNPQAIIVIDEVYAEFNDFSLVEEIKNYSNLAVLRSFSKSYGMAGNRIGYIVAEPQIIKCVAAKTQWANVSYLSVGAAMIALDHEEYFTNLISETIDRREKFKTFLQEKNYTVLPSKINAVLLKFTSESEGSDFVDKLKSNNFVVSHGNGGSNIGLDTSFVRITIGTEDQMNLLKNIL